MHYTLDKQRKSGVSPCVVVNESSKYRGTDRVGTIRLDCSIDTNDSAVLYKVDTAARRLVPADHSEGRELSSTYMYTGSHGCRLYCHVLPTLQFDWRLVLVTNLAALERG